MERENTKDKYKTLRKLLTVAALAVALISFYTTANGLYIYVFTEHIWQAYVLSMSLQGALFSLSIMGIRLVLELDIWWKRLFLIGAWLLLLCASSVFSYIYISGDVYTDTLLREDAQRILSTYCLEENYVLRAEANELLSASDNGAGIVSEMNNYVALLATTENGVEFSDSDKTQLETLRNSLLPYAYNYTGDSASVLSIRDCIDTSFLVSSIDVILSGKYADNDIMTIRNEVQSVTSLIAQKIETTNNIKATKETTASEYQNRLNTFRNTTSEAYTLLREDLATVLGEIADLDMTVTNLNAEQESINRVETVIGAVEGSMESVLYNQILQIYTKMNAEEIDVDSVLLLAEDVYSTLLENGVAADDIKLVEYSKFRSNLREYAAVVEAQQSIDTEIDSLYALTETVVGLPEPNEGTDIEESIDIAEDTEIEDKSTVEEYTLSQSLTMDEIAWNNYWRTHLNSLKRSAQLMQTGGLDTGVINNLIESTEAYERLYLSDLNDFERAFALLFGINPSHSYKSLLVFSFCFSFGIDLFSVLMSCLLHLFRPRKEQKCK